MTAKSKKPELRLPAGLSPAEEAQWWDERPEYWDQIDTPYEVADSMPVRRTMPVNLRLPIDMVEALKTEAARQDSAYQTSIRVWLQERLDGEAKLENASPFGGS